MSKFGGNLPFKNEFLGEKNYNIFRARVEKKNFRTMGWFRKAMVASADDQRTCLVNCFTSLFSFAEKSLNVKFILIQQADCFGKQTLQSLHIQMWALKSVHVLG